MSVGSGCAHGSTGPGDVAGGGSHIGGGLAGRWWAAGGRAGHELTAAGRPDGMLSGRSNNGQSHCSSRRSRASADKLSASPRTSRTSRSSDGRSQAQTRVPATPGTSANSLPAVRLTRTLYTAGSLTTAACHHPARPHVARPAGRMRARSNDPSGLRPRSCMPMLVAVAIGRGRDYCERGGPVEGAWRCGTTPRRRRRGR